MFCNGLRLSTSNKENDDDDERLLHEMHYQFMYQKLISTTTKTACV